MPGDLTVLARRQDGRVDRLPLTTAAELAEGHLVDLDVAAMSVSTTGVGAVPPRRVIRARLDSVAAR